jgi:hypothetical protein
VDLADPAAEFDLITSYFESPGADEGFNVIRHERGWQDWFGRWELEVGS